MKSALEGTYQTIFTPRPIISDILGTTDKRKIGEVTKKIYAAYPKELKPKTETPLTNLLAGKSPETGYGPAYDIAASVSDVILFAPYPERFATLIAKPIRAIRSLFVKEPKPTKKAPLTEEYTPQRLPVSRFPSALPEGELVEFQKQRSIQVTKPIKPIELEREYTPQRLPVSRFPATYGVTKTGYAETKLSLGRGIVKFPKEGGATIRRFTGPKPPTKPTKEIETKISKGLLLLMEKPQFKEPFTSTKIALGTSDKILQIRGGKVISDTLTKRKTKPSTETFFIPQSRSTITEQTRRYPPSSKLTLPTLSLLQYSKEQTKISQEITQKTEVKQPSKLKTEVTTFTIQKPTTRLEVTPRLTTKEKQKEKYGYPPFFPTRQTPLLKQPQREIPKQPQKLIEVPKEPPPKLILAFPPLPQPRPKKRAEPKEKKPI